MHQQPAGSVDGCSIMEHQQCCTCQQVKAVLLSQTERSCVAQQQQRLCVAAVHDEGRALDSSLSVRPRQAGQHAHLDSNTSAHAMCAHDGLVLSASHYGMGVTSMIAAAYTFEKRM